ncbi:MAG TPA: hypothetical protein VFE51_25555 [Verrucomicrobiae bacterium]|nr:hypothetical protein [Verrucomicrobiae bacterium]
MPIDDSGTGYLKSVCDYVHLNPARAKLVRAKEKLSSFPWSSLPAISQAAQFAPGVVESRPFAG